MALFWLREVQEAEDVTECVTSHRSSAYRSDAGASQQILSETPVRMLVICTLNLAICKLSFSATSKICHVCCFPKSAGLPMSFQGVQAPEPAQQSQANPGWQE